MSSAATSSIRTLLGRDPTCLATAPGRINLIGEHVDYNDGLVLPIAIDRATTVAAAPLAERWLEVYSREFDERVRIPLPATAPTPRSDNACENPLSHQLAGESPHPMREPLVRESLLAPSVPPLVRESLLAPSVPPHPTWARYVYGVAAVLAARGVPVPGAALYIATDLPLAAGLSSSAALEVSVALTLLHLAGQSLPPPELARACREAENVYAGAPCGIMDQTVVAGARPGHALLIDCRSLDTRHVPFDPPDAGVLVVDTGVRHSIAGEGYAARRRECAAVLELLRQHDPSIRSLRDVPAQQLPRIEAALRQALEQAPLPVSANQAAPADTLIRRLRHVVTETDRVLQAEAALRAADLARFGALMYASHDSLRNDYEVSCPELDLIVEVARQTPGVYGARMTGGGFGGCAIILARHDAQNELPAALAARFRSAFGRDCHSFLVRAAAGATVRKL